jgi:hypothetical protein
MLPDWSEKEQGFTRQRRALYKVRVLCRTPKSLMEAKYKS